MYGNFSKLQLLSLMTLTFIYTKEVYFSQNRGEGKTVASSNQKTTYSAHTLCKNITAAKARQHVSIIG